MFNIIFVNDWSWTADLCYWKQLLYQFSHNHFFPNYQTSLKWNKIDAEYFESKSDFAWEMETVKMLDGLFMFN